MKNGVPVSTWCVNTMLEFPGELEISHKVDGIILWPVHASIQNEVHQETTMEVCVRVDWAIQAELKSLSRT